MWLGSDTPASDEQQETVRLSGAVAPIDTPFPSALQGPCAGGIERDGTSCWAGGVQQAPVNLSREALVAAEIGLD